MSEDSNTVTKAFTLYPRHVAIIQKFAADEDRNDSSALRRIIEEWEQSKLKQLPLLAMVPERAK